GSARSNPEGPGGFGTLIHYVDTKGQLHVREFSAGYKKTTNNRMELMGVITGLEALTKPCEVEVISDSKYVTDAFNKGWVDNWIIGGWRNAQKKTVLNRDLWIRLINAMEPHKVTFTWVKGHAGHPENERCDKLATMAADGDDLLEDTVDETAGMML
ncbi:MAG: ribonuclease HI, partial [Lachnospiraceae bacterium]|nr:ribonuclease HI [Lachnospiraceae bacterium]